VAVTKPPRNATLSATLTWQGDLKFRAATPRSEIILDSDSTAGPSPVEAVAMALAGCMAIDVTDIIVKGRHDLKAIEATIAAQRRDDPPRYFVSFALHFHIAGAVPDHAVRRAIDLSRDKYCSVWHSLRRDIELTTTFEVAPGPVDSANG
jgi:putative redox protein